jgi:hypothetical protein
MSHMQFLQQRLASWPPLTVALPVHTSMWLMRGFAFQSVSHCAQKSSNRRYLRVSKYWCTKSVYVSHAVCRTGLRTGIVDDLALSELARSGGEGQRIGVGTGTASFVATAAVVCGGGTRRVVVWEAVEGMGYLGHLAAGHDCDAKGGEGDED